MKIELDLPEWTKGRHIYIFAGIELAAYRHVGESWNVKIDRCSMCGKCCMNLKEDVFPVTCEGTCGYLKPDGKKLVCSLGSYRPMCCSISKGARSISGCTEKYDPVL